MPIYPKKKSALELKRGFIEGFHLQYNGPRIHNMSKNLTSASEHYEQVWVESWTIFK